MNAQIGGLQGQINNTNNTVSNLTGVAEMQSNKSTATDLGGSNPSDQAYPSQKAAKAYVDQVVSQIATSGVPDATTLAAGKLQLAGDLGGTATNPTVPALANKENTANKSLNVLADGTDNTKYPSVKAVKDYVDQATYGTALAADLANKANIASPAFTGTPTAPTPTLGDNSTKLATTSYVDAQVLAGAADASTTSKGIIKLTGDLGGTSSSPTVPGLALKANTADVTTFLASKEDVSNKSDGALGTSSTLYPTQNAVKTYVDSQVASGAPDATSLVKGKIILAGDLGGTASLPTVPGLALKANTSDVTTSLATKEDASNKSNSALGTSTTLFPTQNAVKMYVDAQVTSAMIADADASTKGKVALAGDLAGTAISPSVVKLRGTPISSVAPTTAGHVLTYDVNGSATWAAPANSANTISGVVPVANGGTGLSSLTSGGAVYATSPSALATGTLPLTAGGTGVTSQQAAINTLTGTQSSGKYLRSDGTDARLSTIQAADVPTLNQNTTGTAANVTGTVGVVNGGTGATTLTGYVKGSGNSALTASASIPVGDLTGTLPISSGGTGASTKTTAFDALSPMTASGDLIYGGNAGTGTRLAKGANGNVLTLANGIPAWSAPAGASAHYVGEAYGGGIVFFVWDNGAHGLIVALNEIGNKGPADFTSTTGMYWGPVLTCGAFRSGYGAGEGNTNVMISKISNTGQQWFVYAQSVTNMYSAMAAQQYTSLYGDWYLPSAEELKLIKANQSYLTGSGYNNTHIYWSSTETNDSYAYGLALNGSTPWYQKTTLNWILPVRKF
jgi:hypothetical protein